MPNFLINMYNICQIPEACVKSRLSPQTLISDIINVMKWVEPALENEKSQRGLMGDSCLGIHFFDDAGLRSRATICWWYNGRDMYINVHLLAPHPHKSHYDAPSVMTNKRTRLPELVILQFREPCWWSCGWKIHLKKLSRFKVYIVDLYFGIGFVWSCSTPNLCNWFDRVCQATCTVTQDRSDEVGVASLAVWMVR